MMTVEAKQVEDGNLPSALTSLDHALHALTAPLQKMVNDQLLSGPSWYMQLWDAVSGEASNGGGAGSGSKSRPPCWIDAMDLCHEIDQTVECWQPAFTGVPPTVGRLHTIRARAWRPQDVRQIEQITKAVTEWAVSIQELLNPAPKWTLPYNCPNCHTKHVYRRDSSGEMVRSYALQLSAEGCRCARCHASWAPGQFMFLGRLLDTVPDNVGE
jgi:hypothetical protein